MGLNGNNGHNGINGDHEKKPYMIVSISGEDIKADKGIGFAIKQSIQAYIDNYGLDAQVRLEEKSSNKFNLFLSIYYNRTSFDFINFEKYIQESGRLPSNIKKIPEIIVKPLPCNSEIILTPEESDKKYTFYLKRIQDLEGELTEEKKKYDLQEEINQNSIQEKNELFLENTKLEKILQSLDKEKTTEHNLLRAITKNVLPAQSSFLKSASDDYELLQENNDLKLYFQKNEKLVEYFEYINYKFDLTLQDNQELEKCLKEIAEYKKWNETPKGIELERKRKELETDTQILKKAQRDGASISLIESMEESLKEKGETFENLDKKIKETKNCFEKLSKYSKEKERINKNYSYFNEIIERTDKRREKNAEISIILLAEKKTEDEIKIFFPNGEDNIFSKKLKNNIKELMSYTDLKLENREETNQCYIWNFKISEKTIQVYGEDNREIKKQIKKIEQKDLNKMNTNKKNFKEKYSHLEDEVLLAFGIKTKIYHLNLNLNVENLEL